MEKLIFQPGLLTIGDSTFKFCVNLKTVEIPSTVNEIGANSFSCCDNLETVIINDGVKTIGSYAFYTCKNLKAVQMTKSVTSMGYSIVGNCPNVIIYCTTDSSYVRGYANEKGIPYKVGYIPVTKPLKPTNVKATALSTEVIKVTWNKVSSADGYEVYRFVNGRSVFYKAFGVNETSFNNLGKVPNTTYYYKMRSYKIANGKKVYSGFTDLVTCKTPGITKPLKPTNVKATPVSTKEIKVTWNKVSGANGYEVYRFVNGKSVFYKAFGVNDTSFNNLGKIPNTTYYYKMRSYKVVNGKKLYSGFTDLVTCTTPKK